MPVAASAVLGCINWKPLPLALLRVHLYSEQKSIMEALMHHSEEGQRIRQIVDEYPAIRCVINPHSVQLYHHLIDWPSMHQSLPIDTLTETAIRQCCESLQLTEERKQQLAAEIKAYVLEEARVLFKGLDFTDEQLWHIVRVAGGNVTEYGDLDLPNGDSCAVEDVFMSAREYNVVMGKL
ncbi:hypothetical protein OCL06_09235 [Alteromonas sp. ASW11-19]|uniref:Uncharacterized protein n=1 Tax=Alteromonas salexigens TaxID=2982530 RepID=A0ABT2VN93_9ALTE|nr:hypothetical protein [Alteromonas salexigens]MCU7554782.1 hypothetical protein [Alteromonas salexigens]